MILWHCISRGTKDDTLARSRNRATQHSHCKKRHRRAEVLHVGYRFADAVRRVSRAAVSITRIVRAHQRKIENGYREEASPGDAVECDVNGRVDGRLRG